VHFKTWFLIDSAGSTANCKKHKLFEKKQPMNFSFVITPNTLHNLSTQHPFVKKMISEFQRRLC